MKKNIRLVHLALSFLALPQFILPATAFAEVRFCNQMTAFKPKVSLAEVQLHAPRLLALQMNDDRMMRDLLALTGRVPVDCEGCIRDRFRETDKQRARQFLIKRLDQMGLKVTIERTKLPKPSYDDNEGGWIPAADRFKAVNWKYISDADLRYLFFECGLVSDMRAYVIKYLGWPAEKESFKRLTIPMLEEIVAKTDRGTSTEDKEYTKELEKKGLHVGLTNSDAGRMLRMLRNGESMQPPTPPPTKKKARRKGPTPDDALVADDASKVVNIVAEIRGTKRPDEIVEIIAHYDTKKEDAGGADDNGVGLVTSLELMRLMQNHPPSRTVRVIFSDREEIDSLGAEFHVKKLKSRPNEKIVGVLVPDMFGYSPLGRPRFVLELGAEKDFTNKKAYAFSKEFALSMAKQWDLYGDRVADMEVITFSAESDMGDHGPYWDANLPAIFIASPLKPENPANHSARDKVENMNFGLFTEVSHFLGEVLSRHAGASVTVQDMAHESNMSFLKSVLKPGAERTDAAAELYFEIERKYTLPNYATLSSTSGTTYAGSNYMSSYSGISSGSSYTAPGKGKLFDSDGNYVPGGRKQTSSDDDKDHSVPRPPPLHNTGSTMASGGGTGYSNSGPAGFPVGNKGPSAGTNLGGSNSNIRPITDLDKGKKPPALLTAPPATGKPLESKPTEKRPTAGKAAANDADSGGGFIDTVATKMRQAILFRNRITGKLATSETAEKDKKT